MRDSHRFFVDCFDNNVLTVDSWRKAHTEIMAHLSKMSVKGWTSIADIASADQAEIRCKDRRYLDEEGYQTADYFVHAKLWDEPIDSNTGKQTFIASIIQINPRVIQARLRHTTLGTSVDYEDDARTYIIDPLKEFCVHATTPPRSILNDLAEYIMSRGFRAGSYTPSNRCGR